jgi:hypothetical protein
MVRVWRSSRVETARGWDRVLLDAGSGSPVTGWAKAVPGASEPQEHGVEPDQAQCPAVELAHLGEHVGLLDPLDDVSAVDPDVDEEAGLVGALGGWRPVQPPGGRPADRAVGQGDVAAGEDLVEVDAQVRQAFPDPGGLISALPPSPRIRG